MPNIYFIFTITFFKVIYIIEMIFIGVIPYMVDQLTQTTVIRHLFSSKYIRFIYKIQYLTENNTIISVSYGFITLIKSYYFLLLSRIFLVSLLRLPTFWF